MKSFLQTLGWGRYLAERNGQVPVLWQATTKNSFLHGGYELLTSNPPPTPASTLAPTPSSASLPYERECEYPDEATVGQPLERTNASGLMVHGQFGTVPAWPAKSGSLKYNNIHVPQTPYLYLKLQYSKYSPATVPILIFIDNETTPRFSFIPEDQGDWNNFVWTEPIDLGSVEDGTHSIKFYTNGQEYGVADLDKFVLTVDLP